MYRKFSFIRITEKIPYRITLQKTATETNFNNELQARWFYSRWWYHIDNNRFKSIVASIFILIDYKWGIFLRTFNFFTDGRIKTFFKKKILGISDTQKYQDKLPPNSSYSHENTEKLCQYFYETDHSLLLGFPRWMLVEALAEEFGLEEKDHIFREFYRITSDNPLKPKAYNFTMNEMFKFLEAFEVKLKKPVEGQIDGLIEKMRGKMQKAEEANQAWVLKKEQQKNKMFEEMRKINHNVPVQLEENESKLIQIKEEIMGLDSSPQSMERMKVLMGQLQVLQSKKNS